MKRSGPPKRKTPMKRDGQGARDFANQRSAIKPRSKKRSTFMATDRVPYIKALVEAGVGCEICPMLDEAGLETHCAGRIEGLHERRKRSSGGSLTNRANLVPACNWGNGLIEDKPALMRELFGSALIVREADPEWVRLGAREDS